MDSLTQVVLGGAVGYAVLGNQVGRKAAIYGAVLGTLPDLDVFLPYSGEVEAFTYHRSFSHSLLVHFVATPIIAWLIMRVHAQPSSLTVRWYVLVYLSLATHALLDSCTVYGTQLLWPVTEYPFGISNLFIIDPAYTLPLLVAFIVILLPRLSFKTKHYVNGFGLALSSLYLLWTLGAKVYIDSLVNAATEQRNINSIAYLSTPAPFTTLLWRVLIMQDDRYYEGYVSIFDNPQDINLVAHDSQNHLTDDINSEWGLNRLQWFTKGFYSINSNGEQVILSDLRMGTECNYVFNFVVGTITPEGVVKGSYEKTSQRPELSGLNAIFERISDPTVSLAPNKTQGLCEQYSQQ